MTKRALRRGLAIVVAGAAGLVVSLVATPPAQAVFPGYSYFVRPHDFVHPTGTRGDASLDLQADGEHIHTGDPSALVAGTFDPPGGSVPLGDFNLYGYQVTYTWTGSADQPAIHYDIDLDGDGRADLELVGEHKDGDDLWLNEDFYDAHPTVAFDAILAAAPCVGDDVHEAPRQGCNSTYGDRYHGGIYDWTSGFAEQGFSEAAVVQGGFVATGGHIDGVLSTMSLGIYRYVFTSTQRSRIAITLTTDAKQVARGGTVVIRGDLDVPGYPTVVLQRRIGDRSWHTVDTFKLFYGPSFVDPVTAPTRPGVVRYRIIVPESNANLRTISRAVRLRVTGD